jgi:hypothetical protein
MDTWNGDGLAIAYERYCEECKKKQLTPLSFWEWMKVR